MPKTQYIFSSIKTAKGITTLCFKDGNNILIWEDKMVKVFECTDYRTESFKEII